MRQFDKDGVLTRLIAVRPDRCKGFVEKWSEKYGWFQDKVCLAEHLLVGPFKFVRRPSPESARKIEKHRIGEEIWEQLEVVGRACGLSMVGIHTQERVHTAMINIDVWPDGSSVVRQQPESK